MPKKLLVFFISLVSFLGSTFFVYAHFIDYWPIGYRSSVDEWEIRWDGSTQYSEAWNTGIANWNALGLVNIAPDIISTYEDLTVSDVYAPPPENWIGAWSPSPGADTLKLNTYYMDQSTPSGKQNTTTHELGHALGLDHSILGNTMYYANTGMVGLGNHDILDYNIFYGSPSGIPISINPSSGINIGSVGISSIGTSGSGFTLGWDREIGLLANWRMNEESPGMSLADASGNDVIGTPYNITVESNPGNTAKLGYARTFTSTSSASFGDKVDIAQTSPATISFWYKGTPTSGRWVIDKEEDSGQYRGYSAFFLNFGSGTKLVWRIGQNDVGGKRTYCSNNSPLPSDGNWHYYVIAQQGGTSCVNNVNMYIDGLPQDSNGGILQWDQGIGDSASSGSSLYLGSSVSGSSVVGSLDETRIYNRVLSQEEVNELKNVTSRGIVRLTRQGYNDISCQNFSWTSPTALANGNCAITGAATGAWNVVVTNPDNTAGSLTNGFTVTNTGNPQCSDGLDNDGDTKTDYPTDTGCISSSDNDEYEYGGDTSPPAISSVSASQLTSTSAVLSWTTNEISTSDADYGFTTSYGQSAEFNGDLVTVHSLPISNLYPNTLYHYRVKSRDPSGNEGVSGDYTFTTYSDANAPVVSSITPSSGLGNVNITSITGSNFKVGWDKENNLLSNWHIDETINNALNDVSGNNISGQSIGPTIVPGKFGNARNFASTSDYIYFTNAQNLSQTLPATVSFWWKGTPISGRYVMSKEDIAGLYQGFSVFFHDIYTNSAPMKLIWRIGQNDVGGKRTYCSMLAAPLADNNWHYITITQSGGSVCVNNVSMYIDGISQSISQWDTGLGSAASTIELRLGATLGGYSSTGATDEVRVYNRALSASEVIDLYNYTMPPTMKLTRTGFSDILCSGFTRSSSASLTDGLCSIFLGGTGTGYWNVEVKNSDNGKGILPNGFYVNSSGAFGPMKSFFARLFGNFVGTTHPTLAVPITTSGVSAQGGTLLKKPSYTKISPYLNLKTATIPLEVTGLTPRIDMDTATIPMLIERIEE